MKSIKTAPEVQTLTATGVEDDDTYNLSQMDSNSGRRSMNMIPLVLNFDVTEGDINLNLFAISDLLTGAGAGVGFHIHGTIIAGINDVIVNPYMDESYEDTICGRGSMSVSGEIEGILTAFMIWVSGRNNWGMAYCIPTPSIG